MSVYWQRFPCLAQYNPATTVATPTATPGTYPGVILWMLDPGNGMVIYIPPIKTVDDPNKDLELSAMLSPKLTEIAPPSKGVYVKNGQDPSLV